MTTTTPHVRTAAPPQWYRDYVSCLQSTLATLLLSAGRDAVGELGLSWEFYHLPGEVRAEEFYWPCRRPGDVAGSLLPYHGVTSAWRQAPAEGPLGPLEEALGRGQLPIVAVDNYYLPFRPAYGDIHSAHLIVVCALDRDTGRAWVSDAMPPAYHGPLDLGDLMRSWTSPNPREQEAFFSGAQIEGRWLDVTLGRPAPPLSPHRLAEALTANLDRFASAPGSGSSGLPGLAEFSRQLVDAARCGNRAAVEAVYPFGWGMQAQAALHGELLRRCGTAWASPLLSEAGRRAEHVAHAWTPVRICCAYGREDPPRWAGEIDRAAGRLRRAYEEALAAVSEAAAALEQGGGEHG